MRKSLVFILVTFISGVLSVGCSSETPTAVDRPDVEILKYDVISRDSAYVQYTVKALELISHGIKYSTESNLIDQGELVTSKDGKVTLDNLMYNTTYYVQAFGTNVLGTSKSDVISFQTDGPKEYMDFDNLAELKKYMSKYTNAEPEVSYLTIGGDLLLEDYMFLGELGDESGRFPSLKGLVLTQVDSIISDAFNSDLNKAATWLESISAPNAVSIGDQAFLNCSLLSDIYFPSVTLIKTQGLYNIGTTDFTKEQLPSVVEWEDNVVDATKVNSIVLPSLKEVANNLRNTPKIRYVEIGLEEIPSKMMVFSEGITEFGERSFLNATSIGDLAFAFCSNLKRATFPKVNTIGSVAFSFSNQLIQLRFDSDIEQVAPDAFDEFNTQECILLLTENTAAQAQGQVWQGKTWKAIITL
ncbi:leucine-rich repeat protein [Myroides sp. LJL116]